MAVKVYIPHAIVFASGTNISQLENLSPDFGFEDVSIMPAGAVFPGFTGSASAKPMLEDSTTQIAEILSRCGSAGDYVAAAFSNSAIKFQWVQASNLGTRIASTSTSDHLVLRALYSLLTWSQITAAEGGLARINFGIRPVSNGGNAPLVQLAEAITTVPVGDAYKLGPVVLNTGGGATTLCVDSWTLNTNLTFKEKRCSGFKYYEFCAVQEAKPEATIETEDFDLVASLLPDGLPITSVDFYLRKLDQGKIEVAAATEEHIKISATAGTAKPTGKGTMKLQLHGLVTDTASALP